MPSATRLPAARSASSGARHPRAPPSQSRTPASASRRSICRGSPSASTGSIAAARAKPAAPDWASPSSSTPSRATRRASTSTASRAQAAASRCAFRCSARCPPSRRRALATRDRNEQTLAHDILAGDHFVDVAALLVEYHRCQLLQYLARLLDAMPARVHPRQLLDETDVAVLGLEINRGECKLPFDHFSSLTLVTLAVASPTVQLGSLRNV